MKRECEEDDKKNHRELHGGIDVEEKSEGDDEQLAEDDHQDPEVVLGLELEIQRSILAAKVVISLEEEREDYSDK